VGNPVEGQVPAQEAVLPRVGWHFLAPDTDMLYTRQQFARMVRVNDDVSHGPRPEAEVVRRFRQDVGDDVPIMGTLDLHDNGGGRFLKWADGAIVTKWVRIMTHVGRVRKPLAAFARLCMTPASSSPPRGSCP